MKLCAKCKEHKCLSEFSKDKGSRDGLSGRCRTCAKVDLNRNYQKYKKLGVCWECKIAPSEDGLTRCKKCAHALNSRTFGYKITYEEKQELIHKQKNRCAICDTEALKLFVDHDHTNGKVRGLLCRYCNTRLESLENKKWLESAERYLKNAK